MLKSCWIIAVVIGLAFSQSLQAQEQTSPTEDRAIHQQELLDQKPSGIPIRIIEDSDARDARERSDREREQREKADLEAQTKMAQWAEGMLWVSIFSALVSGFGLFLLGFTLRYTKKAADAAAELYELESQPFLSLEVIDGANFRIIDGKAGFMCGDEFKEGPLFCKIVNGGRSSAIATRICRKWSFCEKGSPTAITIGDPDDRKNPVDNSKRDFLTSIPVGAQSSSPPITTFNDQTSIPLEPKNAYFHGFVEFSDASGRSRGRTGFCFVFLPSISSRGMSVGFPEDTKGHWYYNKIDD
ncbi:hypothetical protein [Roseovarius mucosus]|uniref:hypothetical protein n=1 Tax=Roseovarius mucosus TaxID=215743 RepID=UPI003F6F795C